MNNKLDKYLVKKYPNLYRDRNADMRSTCMCWGFDCGNGWYRIIERLSYKLEQLIIALGPQKEGWEVCASQVKEKYGSLRFYMTTETDEMAELIRKAENKSEKTCEHCGKPGKIIGGGWLYCRCRKCAKKLGIPYRLKRM